VKTKVILIGGAPGTGKTTLGNALAARLGIASLTIDDLLTAALAVTTVESHPSLHIMRGESYLDYFTNRSIEQLKADAELQHETVWSMVRRVISTHAAWGSAIVIEGWHLRPNKVAKLAYDNVHAVWIVAATSVIEERERKNVEWLRGSSNPEQMLANFTARSLWHNELIREQAIAHQMAVLFQDGSKSAKELCDLLLEVVN
jgi:2-phosphoglycerate kinase